jgi:hypothetical protein
MGVMGCACNQMIERNINRNLVRFFVYGLFRHKFSNDCVHGNALGVSCRMLSSKTFNKFASTPRKPMFESFPALDSAQWKAAILKELGQDSAKLNLEGAPKAFYTKPEVPSRELPFAKGQGWQILLRQVAADAPLPQDAIERVDGVVLHYADSDSCKHAGYHRIEYQPRVANAHRPESTEDYYDPIAAFARTSEESLLTLPHTYIPYADGTAWFAAGLPNAWQLALVVATADWFLTHAKDASSFAPSFLFKLGIGRNFFLEAAKLRALPFLWEQLLAKRGIHLASDYRMPICASTAGWPLCRANDVPSNLIRTQLQVLSAVFGNASEVEVSPHVPQGHPDLAFAARIAANQALLLKNESWLAEVVDPLAGTWYVEALTDSLVEASSEILAQIDSAGGIIAFLPKAIEKAHANAAILREQFRNQKETIIGYNKYPNPNLPKLDLGMGTTSLNKKLLPQYLWIEDLVNGEAQN